MANPALKIPAAEFEPATTNVATFEIMKDLNSRGFWLMGLGKGDDGKKPLVTFEDRKPVPLDATVRMMHEAHSTIYAIRTRGILVIDCDTDNSQTLALVEKQFGLSPYKTKTPRGWHFYYRATPIRLKNIKLPDQKINIEFKTGENSYVVGPGSIRPDGGEYELAGLPFGRISDFPEIIAQPANVASSQIQNITALSRVSVGDRWATLKPRAREYVEFVNSEQELVDELVSWAKGFCDDFETLLPDIAKCAKWTWQKRLEGKLYSAANTAISLTRQENFALAQLKHGSDAFALLAELRAQHCGSKRKGKSFPLCRRAMARDNIMPNWKEGRYQQAIKPLLETGLVVLQFRGKNFSENGQIKRQANLYALGRLIEQNANTVRLTFGKSGGRGS
jgi:Bifunctional DNA primase/polymerase, N-terminal